MAHLFEMNPARGLINSGLAAVLLLAFCAGAAAKEPKAKPASLKISGYGVLGNRQLRRTLVTLEFAGNLPEFLSASFIEDAALIITSRVKRDGFLEPEVTVEMELSDGKVREFNAIDLMDNPLPRELRIRKVRFHIRKGRLYHYDELQFEGLKSITEKEARSYF